MSCQLRQLCFDSHDPPRLAQFWAAVLSREIDSDCDYGAELLPTDDANFIIAFYPSDEIKTNPNQMHFDLTSSSLDHQRATVRKAIALGATHIDIGQGAEATHVVLADPEENEFCVIEPGNNFLADCGFIGALACEGSREVGYFWSEVLGWPLVWDENQETAIRSPLGGPKITWGGAPMSPTTTKCRLHFDIAPPANGDQCAEVDRLISLGASHIDIGQGDANWVVMTDPDGHEFCVLTPR